MDRKFWNKVSANYNKEIFNVSKRDKNGIVKKWVYSVSSPKKSIADFGCGVGNWLPMLSPKFKEVHAIDFSGEHLKQINKNYKDLGNITTKNVDLTKAWKSKEKFDTMLCVNAILNAELSKRKVIYKNIQTNLKPKGHLILVVPSIESVIYSHLTFEKINPKEVLKAAKTKEKINKVDLLNLKHGVMKLDTVFTKHHLKEELFSTLTDLGFHNIKIDKVEYSWETEIDNPPRSLKAPYPWDWIVMAEKK
jgi:2-polyprenyl-3-methyl-5-hydroxy-6-metoxy-1,4-benzoquinol methylase